MKPQTWIEEDRGEIAETITENIVASMTLEEMRQQVWDMFYDDIVHQNWDIIWEYAETYAPELLEKFKEGG
jgi:hypothetical protein